jgi:hypothetical protein
VNILPAIELVISCDGFPLYKRKFQDIRAIDDDDVIAASLFAVFYRIQKSMVPSGGENNVVKLDMGQHHMHVMKLPFTSIVQSRTRDIHVYLVEDGNLTTKVSAGKLRKIVNGFLEKYQVRIDDMIKKETDTREFDAVVDRILTGKGK